jgi:hypothetical protein
MTSFGRRRLLALTGGNQHFCTSKIPASQPKSSDQNRCHCAIPESMFLGHMQSSFCISGTNQLGIFPAGSPEPSVSPP